ncbi:MAG: acyltransferase [Myxococcota bacterium]|nr:acyltransferase [Myxococcota bacterium]
MAEPAPSASRVHVPALDGIRGLAIAIVVAFHYLTAPHHHPLGHAVWTVARAGWLGVDLFFVLSGFLITGILISARAKPHYFRDFYVRRTLRIFPLYYATLALVFGVLAFLPLMQTESFAALASRQGWLWGYGVNVANAAAGELLFVSDRFEANHFWSLAAEEQFYILWPAIVWSVPPRRLAIAGVVVTVLSFGLKALLTGDETSLMLLRSDGLVLGGAIAAAMSMPAWRSVVVRGAPIVLAMSASALGLMFVIRGGLHHDDVIAGTWAPSLVALGGGALVVVATQADAKSLLVRALTVRPLLELGKYSYGLYVIHWAFAPLFRRFVATDIAVVTGVALLDVLLIAALKAAIALALAVASFHLFEKRFLVLKDRFAPLRR